LAGNARERLPFQLPPSRVHLPYCGNRKHAAAGRPVKEDINTLKVTVIRRIAAR
jgi:hypothetical protein